MCCCMGLPCIVFMFFFFKQKTAYEMRISDWSSDVCSSDLLDAESTPEALGKPTGQDASLGKATFVGQLGVREARERARALVRSACARLDIFGEKADLLRQDRKSVVSGKSVSVRVDIGGRRLIKKKKTSIANKVT